jgi:MOSC domain-containing protein YiiM
MRLLSVNVGQAEPMERGNETIQTAIFKRPVSQPVFVSELGLDGDDQVSKQHHGGPDQAVYVYSEADYAWWAGKLGALPVVGSFGENLTLSEFGVQPLYIGDRWQIGEVLLEVTGPRIPCATFAARMGDPEFVKKFKQAERPGAYARVLQTGRVQAGQAVVYQRGSSEVTVREVFRLYYDAAPSRATIVRVLSAPITSRGRLACEKMLDD